MTSPFLAGQKLRASWLNERLPTLVTTSSVSVTSSTTLVVTGLVVSLDADSTYIWDAYLAYSSPAAADLKVAFVGPAGATGSWALGALSSAAATGGVGDLDARREDGYLITDTLVAGGSDSGLSLACAPHGTIFTAAASGSLSCYIAQNTSNATSATLNSTSWLRVQPIPEASV